MLKKFFLALCCAGLLAPAGAWANHEGEIDGTITAINGSVSPPTVTVTQGSTSVVLRIFANTRIELDDDAAGGFGDLAVGQRVEAEYDRSTFQAFEIDVEDADEDADHDEDVKVTGRVISVSATELVLRPNGSTQNLTLRITDRTRVELGGVSLNPDLLSLLRGLPVPVRVGYDSSNNEVEEVKVDLPERLLQGAIVSIGADGKVTVKGTGFTLTFTLTDDVPIFFRGQQIRLSDLRVGDLLKLRAFLVSGGRFLFVRAEKVDVPPQPKTVAGILIAVSGSTFTVRPLSPNEAPVTLTVDAQTRIKINNGQTGTVANLAALLAQATARRVLVKVTAQYLPTGAFPARNVNVNVNFGGRGR